MIQPCWVVSVLSATITISTILTTCTDPYDGAVQVGDRDCSQPEGRVPVSLNDAQVVVASLLSSLIAYQTLQIHLKLFVVML